MSGMNSPRDGGPSAQPKQMTSRLMNMKFMQRAAATNKSRTPHTPSTPNGEPALKRRRTGDYLPTSDNSPASRSASTATTPTFRDRATISDRFKAGADGTSIALGQRILGSENNETEWMLAVHFPTTNGHYNSTYDNDEDQSNNSEAESEDDIVGSTSTPSGRQTYGAFKRKKKTSTSTSKTPQSQSKSAKRNAASHQRKRTASEADLSSSAEEGEASDDSADGSDSNSNSESDSEDDETDEPNVYASSRDQAARHKKIKGVDYTSKKASRKMDAMNYFSRGSPQVLGRDRKGLNVNHTGGGGGGGGGGRKGATNQNRNGLVGQDMFGRTGDGGGGKNKTKKRKTM